MVHESTNQQDEGRGSNVQSLRFQDKTWLDVPFEQKDEAFKAGARWDQQERCWYAPKGSARSGLVRWLPEARGPRLDPEQEFAQALRDAGLRLDGPPVMDGKPHRVAVEGGKRGAKDGFYVGHLDGRPAGYFCNHRTGQKEKWRSSETVRLSPKQRAEFATKQRERALYRELAHERRANELQAAWKRLSPATDKHPYLASKGVASYGLRQTKSGALIVPLRDADGKLRSMQKIAADGMKSFPKDARKSGCFHVIGELRGAREVMVCEGYATGASLHQATGATVAVAFDAGNLKAVATSLRESRGADVCLLVMADNDHRAKSNVGVEMAQSAAREVDGVAIVPRFNNSERAAGLTDWNDLHQARGIDGLRHALGDRLDLVKDSSSHEIGKGQLQQREQHQGLAFSLTR